MPHIRVFYGVLFVHLVTAIALTAGSTSSPYTSYSKIPLAFEENDGQAPADVRFIARGPGYLLMLGSDRASFRLTNSRGDSNLEMRWIGSAMGPEVTGRRLTETRTNYLIGQDPRQWRTNVRNYDAVEYKSLYPHINAVFYGRQRQLEYDLVVGPGGDPANIRLELTGVSRVSLQASGDLVLSTPNGDLIKKKPVSYQTGSHGRRPVEARYVLLKGNQVGIRVGRYDAKSTLVIDPMLVYSTFLGATGGGDFANAVAVDPAGNTYLTGGTSSASFPLKNPVQGSFGGGVYDVFVSKINAAGTALIYSTYLGGSGYDMGNAIAADAAGNAYVTGQAISSNFPTTAGAFQKQGNPWNYSNVFVVKLDPTGSNLLFSTYLDGQGPDWGQAIAIDSTSNVYVAGTAGQDFPTTAGAFQRVGLLRGAFVAKLKPDGSGLIFSTYLVSYKTTVTVTGLALNPNDNSPCVTGYSEASDFPTTPGAYETISRTGPGAPFAFVTRFLPDGSALAYSTLLGGSGNNYGRGIAVDSDGNMYVAGDTTSTDFPSTGTISGSTEGNVFVTKLNPTLSSLVYSVRFGSNAPPPTAPPATAVSGIALDPNRNAVISGVTTAADFPVTASPVQTMTTYENTGVFEGFVSKLNTSGSGFVYSTYLGFGETAGGVATDPAGNVYVSGNGTGQFPATAGAVQTATTGEAAFLAKVSDTNCAFSISPVNTTVLASGGTVPVTISGGPGCTWAAIAPGGFAQPGPATGTGSGSTTLTVSSNPGNPRTVFASIAGNTFTLNQKSTCVFEVNFAAPGAPLPAAGGNAGTFSVSSGPNCVAEANSSAGWLTVGYSGNLGSTNGGFVASPNFGSSSRSATVTIADQIFTMTQLGGYVCAWALTPAQLSVASAGGTFNVAVGTATTCNWSVSSNASWLNVLSAYPTSESGSVVFTADANTGYVRTGTLTIGGQTFTVTQAGLPIPPPIGSVDTPADNMTGVTGALGFTGWALSNVGIASVQFWREANPGEAAAGTLVFVGNAVIVPGARPDIASVCPACPGNNAGYGAQILTNELPANSGSTGVGNGIYRIHVLATDNASQTADLGVRSMTVNNSQAVLPFGTIDTPQVGSVVSGSAYVNFGWAVTPNPANAIATDGSTIWVFIDNQPVGHPVYNNNRADIAALFPGLKNSNGAVGYYLIDTTKLTNGLHTIAWSVADSGGNVQGIGSRFFNVEN